MGQDDLLKCYELQRGYGESRSLGNNSLELNSTKVVCDTSDERERGVSSSY
jgi:hypothetical protein